MFEEEFEIVVNCEWHGLLGRHLFELNGRRYIPPNESIENDVRTDGTFTQKAVTERLPDVVKALTSSMYDHFDFFSPPDSFYFEELAEMQKNRV